MPTNTTESISKTDLEFEVTEMLHKARIPAHIKGFNFLRTAIILSVEDREMVHGLVTKALYPEIARQFQTTPSRVERAIRHALEVSWNRGAYQSLSKELPYEIGDEVDQPTNSEFIAAIADYLRLKSKRG